MDDASYEIDELDDASRAYLVVTNALRWVAPQRQSQSKRRKRKGRKAKPDLEPAFDCCVLCDWRPEWNDPQSDYHTGLALSGYGSKTRTLAGERIPGTRLFDDPICTECRDAISKNLALLEGRNGWMKKLRNADERREIKKWRERYNRDTCTLAERDKAIEDVEARSRARHYRETFYAQKQFQIEPGLITPPDTYDADLSHSELSYGYSHHRWERPPRQDVNHKELHYDSFKESRIGTGPGEKRGWTTVARRAAAAWKEYGPQFPGWGL